MKDRSSFHKAELSWTAALDAGFDLVPALNCSSDNMRGKCLLYFTLVTLHAVSWAFSTEYGLTGFPANSYDPVCATACYRCLYGLTLDCSNHDGATIGMMTFVTNTECYAGNEPFLKSVAWCANTKCADVSPLPALMEYWWDQQITGQKDTGARTVPAKWSYGETLSYIMHPPTFQLEETDTALNTTALVPHHQYAAQYNVLASTQREGVVTNTFGYSHSAYCLLYVH